MRHQFAREEIGAMETFLYSNCHLPGVLGCLFPYIFGCGRCNFSFSYCLSQSNLRFQSKSSQPIQLGCHKKESSTMSPVKQSCRKGKIINQT